MRVRCPNCRCVFDVGDIHRPFRCPRCFAVLVMWAPDFKPEVLIYPHETEGDV